MADEDKRSNEDETASNVKLYEDGVEQTNNFRIEWLNDVQTPISIVFAMDVSYSMSYSSMNNMRNGVKFIIDAMKPEDKAAVIKFYAQPQVMVGLTSDKAALYRAIDAPPDDRDYTNIYDTVYDAVDLVAGSAGRLAVILLTDGRHQLETGTVAQYTLEEAIANAMQ